MNKRQVGTTYENIAVQYLTEQGYEILEQNYRNKLGEIDILAKDKDTIVAVEVKYRKDNNYGDALEAVDYRKQRKISRAFFVYYSSHGYEEDIPCRFDVIAVYGNGKISHIRDAFDFIY